MNTLIVPTLTSLIYAMIPSVPLYTPAIDLTRFGQYASAASCFIIFVVMMLDPPRFLQRGQKESYAQMIGFGFLTIAIQSYYAATVQGEETLVMAEAAISATIAVLVYNLDISALSRPSWVTKNSTPFCGEQIYFALCH